MRRMFEGLDTTPGQEKEIKKAVDDVMEAAQGLKDDLRSTKTDIGKAFESDDFDAETMAELMTRHDEKIDEVRRAMVGGLARVHESLDSEQRQRLASFLQRGNRWNGGPYRNYA